MKTFLSDLFPKLHRYSEKLDNLTMLTNQHWISIDNIISTKTVYIFRTNNELLVSKNGKVEKGKWEFLGNKSLLIDKNDECYLFKHGFFDENILALKVDSSEEYAVFVNENNYDGELNSIDRVFDFLNKKYLDPTIKSSIESSTGQIINIQSNIQIVKRETINNDILKIVAINNEAIGAKVYHNEKLADDGVYIYKSLTHKLIVRQGAIVERFFLETVNDLIFEKIYDSEPVKGDRIYNLNWEIVPNGKYKYSFFKSFIVSNGKIV
jgi:hypothetical protein